MYSIIRGFVHTKCNILIFNTNGAKMFVLKYMKTKGFPYIYSYINLTLKLSSLSRPKFQTKNNNKYGFKLTRMLTKCDF